MRKIGYIKFIAVLFLVFAFARISAAVIPPWEIEGLKNKPAPQFAAEDMQGEKHSLEDYRGRVVLLNFWATWCSPCRREMPALIKLHERYRDKGVVLLAISVDESKAAIKAFTRKLPLPFPVISDPEENISSLYKVFAYPTSFLIGKNGRIEEIITGERDWLAPEFTSRLEKLMKRGDKGEKR